MKNCTKLRYRFHKSAKVMTFLCTSEKIMILFQLDKGAIENIDERLKESLSIYLKRKVTIPEKSIVFCTYIN